MGRGVPKKEEVLSVLVNNADLLECLTEEPLTKRTLAEKINVSTKTVYRRTRTLRELGLITKSNGKYRLTSLGKVHIDMFLDVRKISNLIYDHSELLTTVDHQQLPPYWIMYDARIVSASPHAPEQLTNEINRKIDNSTQVKAISPTVLSYHFNIAFKYVRSSPSTAELLLKQPAIEHLVGEYSANFDYLLNSGLELWEYEATVPFGMLLVESPDPCVIVSFLGPHNRPNGLLVTDTVASLDWATEFYAKYRSDASRIDDVERYM